MNSGAKQRVLPTGELLLNGMAVPEGWLVLPHASQPIAQNPLTKADVERIIEQGRREAEIIRAAIRLDVSTGIPRPEPKHAWYWP